MQRTTTIPTKHGRHVTLHADPYGRVFRLEIFDPRDNPKSRQIWLTREQADTLARALNQALDANVSPSPARGLALLFGVPEVVQ